MAEKYSILRTTLEAIADAIREMLGVSGEQTPENMPAAIRSIQGGSVSTVTAIDCSEWSEGKFTATFGTGEPDNYTVQFDSYRRPIKVTRSDGSVVNVTPWPDSGDEPVVPDEPDVPVESVKYLYNGVEGPAWPPSGINVSDYASAVVYTGSGNTWLSMSKLPMYCDVKLGAVCFPAGSDWVGFQASGDEWVQVGGVNTSASVVYVCSDDDLVWSLNDIPKMDGETDIGENLMEGSEPVRGNS